MLSTCRKEGERLEEWKMGRMGEKGEGCDKKVEQRRLERRKKGVRVGDKR